MFKLFFLFAVAQAGLIAGLPAAEHLQARSLPGLTTLRTLTSYASAVTSFQTATSVAAPGTTGTFITSVTRKPKGPFINAVYPTPSAPLTADITGLAPAIAAPTAAQSSNIFQRMAYDAPPSVINQRADHPLKKNGIADKTGPVHTNKFYANFFLGDQGMGTWTHPYSLSFSKGVGNAKSWGIAVTHIEKSQFAFASGSPAEFFIAPIGLQSFIFSAAELGGATSLTVDSLEAFSAVVNLAQSPGAKNLLSMPLVQGMGFVTGLYDGATPWIQSSIFFRSLKFIGALSGNQVYKFQVVLEDGTNWLLHVTPSGSTGAPPFKLSSNTKIEGPANFHGTIQVAKNPAGSAGEAIYDAAVGVYATGASLSASVNGNSGSYSIQWTKGGLTSKTLLMFALPHHQRSFDPTTAAAVKNLSLQTTTKGVAKAVAADRITMVENNLPTTIGFEPWSAANSVMAPLSSAARAAISSAGQLELAQDMIAQTNLDSMYYSGKGLAKFAMAIYAVNDLAKNSAVASSGLKRLQTAFATFVNNKNKFPLVYDTTWKGLVSSATYITGDSGMDFGNTFYNDHHFHYAYFVYAAAVIGYLDPSWLKQPANVAWVNLLVRDFASPTNDDPYFPFSRAFDWYHGHSWAKGLFPSGDSKDQESTSEDAFASYAVKMWGKVSGDANMEARANLELAVKARSLQNYFLMESSNSVQPANFIENKVSGILFENKIHHTTYFGAKIEFIEGIHMLPLNPSSAYTRTQTFVREEWAKYFSNGRADAAEGGWKGILYANLAIIDPVTAYNFFANPNFNMANIDGGASRTWYLAYTAGMGGAP